MTKLKFIIPTLVLVILVLVIVGYKLIPKPEAFSTYSNTKYGFSLEYPADWYKVGDTQADNIFFSSKKEEPPMGGISLGARVEIFVLENAENLGLEEWVEWNKSQGGPEEEILAKEEITVGGYKVIKETYIPFLAEAGPPISVYLAKDNHIIQMNYTGREIGLEAGYFGNLENFQHLLDSFKFK